MPFPLSRRSFLNCSGASTTGEVVARIEEALQREHITTRRTDDWIAFDVGFHQATKLEPISSAEVRVSASGDRGFRVSWTIRLRYVLLNRITVALLFLWVLFGTLKMIVIPAAAFCFVAGVQYVVGATTFHRLMRRATQR